MASQLDSGILHTHTHTHTQIHTHMLETIAIEKNKAKLREWRKGSRDAATQRIIMMNEIKGQCYTDSRGRPIAIERIANTKD